MKSRRRITINRRLAAHRARAAAGNTGGRFFPSRSVGSGHQHAGGVPKRLERYVDRVTADAKSAAAVFGGQVDILLTGESGIDAAFTELVQKHLDAFYVPDDARLFGQRAQILTLAARHAVPAIYFSRDWAAAGGLLSYGPPSIEQGRQTGIYTGRILKGEKPADLPVGRAIRFEFIINLATARAIGVEVPPALLSIADEVIE